MTWRELREWNKTTKNLFYFNSLINYQSNSWTSSPSLWEWISQILYCQLATAQKWWTFPRQSACRSRSRLAGPLHQLPRWAPPSTCSWNSCCEGNQNQLWWCCHSCSIHSKLHSGKAFERSPTEQINGMVTFYKLAPTPRARRHPGSCNRADKLFFITIITILPLKKSNKNSNNSAHLVSGAFINFHIRQWPEDKSPALIGADE